MLLSKDKIVDALKSEGLVFSELTLTGEGDYHPYDADWNYRDNVHLQPVHSVTNTLLGADDDKMIAVWMSRLGPFRLPTLVYSFRPSAYKHSGMTASLFFVFVSEDTFEEISPNRTRVTTRYSIGTPKWLRWITPLLKYLLKKQYNHLLLEDVPMRERRGQLRKWGYRFRTDQEGNGFEKGLSLASSQVIVPTQSPSDPPLSLSVAKHFNGSSEYFFGKDDHLGLRIVKVNDELLFFSRLCHHEGASLDSQQCVNRQIQCPWHGRISKPLCSLKLSISSPQRVSTPYHWITLESGILSIRKNDRDKLSAQSAAA